MEQAIFRTNAVLAALTVPAVIALDWTLIQNPIAAALGGFVACLLPLHLRYSASEELWIPGTLFAVWGLAAFADRLSSGRAAVLAIACLALMLAVHSRSELVILPAAYVALVVAVDPPRRWPGRAAAFARGELASVVLLVLAARAAAVSMV